MPRRDPDFYEPSSPEEVRVFDGGEDDLDEEGSRLPLLLVVALIMVFAFGAVVWLAYTQGVQHGREGAPQVIAARSGPVRTAPANPGGATPYQGLKIYDQRAPLGDKGAQPAQAMAKPTTTAPALREANAKPQPLIKPAPQPKSTARLSKVAPAPARTPAPVKTAHLAPRAAVSHPSAAGGWKLQIGAYKSHAEAQTAWKVYVRRHPAVSGLSPDILKVDLGAKGTWYRLRMGSYESRAAATRACDTLKASGAACFPAKG